MQIDYNKRIFGLDIMRAIAILCVVFSHALWIIPEMKGHLSDLLSLLGVMGVEIFFVLSGFLIGRIIYKQYVSNNFSRKSMLYFWIRRWFRTLPNYYLILIVNIAIVLYIGRSLPDSLWKYFFFIQNFSSEMDTFFTESWSLPIEEFAYIIGPLMLYLVLFLKLKIKKSTLFGLCTLVIILFFTITKMFYNNVNTESTMLLWNTNLKAVTLYRIDAIYYGVLAAYFSMLKPEIWYRFRLLFFMIGIGVFGFINVLIPLKQIYIETNPFFWNVLYLPINSVAIVFLLPVLSAIKKAPKIILKPITYISLVSYSMYLLHYSVVLQLLKHFLPTDDLSRIDKGVYILVYLSITCILSYVLYVIFEKPMMNLRDKPSLKKYFQ